MKRDIITAFVFVQTGARDHKTAALLARIPEVEELHRIAGEDCYVVRVRASNTEHLGLLVREKIERIKYVHSTRTTLVLKTLKDKSAPHPQHSPRPRFDSEPNRGGRRGALRAARTRNSR